MEKKRYILEELKAISIDFQDLGRVPDYTVPEGYFEGLALEILDKIKASSEVFRELSEISPLLSGLSKETPFEVPDGYFEKLHHRVQGLTELKPVLDKAGLPSSLENLPKTMPYRVPEHYFEQFADRMLVAVKSSHRPLIVPMTRTRFLVRYAAAAAVLGFIALGAGLYLNNGQKTVDEQLARVPEQAIQEYLQDHTDPLDNEMIYSDLKDSPATTGLTLVSNLSNDDLKAYLDNTINLDENEAN